MHELQAKGSSRREEIVGQVDIGRRLNLKEEEDTREDTAKDELHHGALRQHHQPDEHKAA